jgi:NADH-quinone oxidoreductase subunit C
METAPGFAKDYAYLMERDSADCPSYLCPVGEILGFATDLRDKHGYDLLVDLTAVDWDQDSPRFMVVYHFLSSTGHDYLRIAVNCTDDESPEVPSLSEIYPAADWHERECFDMFGIKFTGHPDMRRILMWEDYPYFPLRKEFPLAGIETPLPAADIAEVTGVEAIPAPMMGGPFVAPSEGRVSESEPRAKDQSWTETSPKPPRQEAATE